MAPSALACRLFIVVVNDDENVAQHLARLLRARGHEVFVAHSEGQAERTLLVHPSDVILIDAELNGADGRVVAERLCGPMRRRPLLIGMTNQCPGAAGSPPDGFDHLVQKPVDDGELADLLLSRTVGTKPGMPQVGRRG